MISEIDIKDWEKIDTVRAYEAVTDLTNQVNEPDAYASLMRFITDVHIMQKRYVKQIPALFKEKVNDI